MIRLIPTLAALLIACAAPVDAVRAEAQTWRAREAVGSPRALERRARHAAPDQKAELLRIAAQRWVARGENRRAVSALSAAIDARPGDAQLRLRRAEAHMAAGATRKAIDDVSRAIDIDPTSAAPYRMRATLWRRVGARDMAIADLARARVLEPRARSMAVALRKAAPTHRTDPLETVSGTANGAPRALTPTITDPGLRAVDPAALDAITIRAAHAAVPPRSLLPPREQAAARASASGDDVAAAPRPARPAILENPALDAVTITAARLQASDAPASTHVASAPPMFPGPAPTAGIPAAPDPIEAHRRRMEAAAIVQRRLEAGAAMMAAMREPAAGGLPDPGFRASTAPLPRIYRGARIPAQLASKAGIARNGSSHTGVGGPYLPVRKAAPPARQDRQVWVPAPVTVVAAVAHGALAGEARFAGSYDATPADPMIEHGVAAPVIAVERGALP